MIQRRCYKCGGELMVDTTSVREFAFYGVEGARLHCLLGCTSIYVRGEKTRLPNVIVRACQGKLTNGKACPITFQVAQEQNRRTLCEECTRLRANKRWIAYTRKRRAT